METLALLGIALLALVQGDGSAVQVEAAASIDVLREEHFLLEIADQGPLTLGAPADGARAVGLAVWRRRIEADGEQVEWEIRFHEPGVPDTRVLHVERLGRDHSKLVWRSWRPGTGRTLIVEWTDEQDALRVLEWGRHEVLREEIEVGDGAVMPLYLQELARDGHLGGGRFRLFDPLSRRLESVRVDCLVDAAAPRAERAGARLERLIELRREDDTLAAAWLFDGDRLQAFQWQAGGPRGRRIPAREYRRRLKGILSEVE